MEHLMDSGTTVRLRLWHFTIDSNRECVKLEKVNIGDIEPARVLYPGNRWRDGSDFKDVIQYNPKKHS